MKSILISIKPRYVADILNHKKTIEIRKSKPNVDLPIDVYIYCTKGSHTGKFGDGLYHEITKGSHWSNGCSWNMPTMYLDSKVVAKFTLNKVEEIERYINLSNANLYCFKTKSMLNDELCEKSCLMTDKLDIYLNGGIGYAWYISDLEIFDKPKELDEFKINVVHKVGVIVKENKI